MNGRLLPTQSGPTTGATGTCVWNGLAAPWLPRYYALE